MKVRNLWVGLVIRNNLEKVVFLRECSMPKKIVKFIMKDTNDEYREVFTKKQLWFKKDNIEPLALFVDIENAKPNMNKRELKEFHKEKETEMKLVLGKTSKRIIGF